MFMALDKMPAAGDYGTLLAQFLPLVVLIVVFYFVLIRPQRKRDKQEREMRNPFRLAMRSRLSAALSAALSQHQGRHAGHRVLERPHQASKIYRWAIRGKEAPATETVEAPKKQRTQRSKRFLRHKKYLAE